MVFFLMLNSARLEFCLHPKSLKYSQNYIYIFQFLKYEFRPNRCLNIHPAVGYVLGALILAPGTVSCSSACAKGAAGMPATFVGFGLN